MEYLELLKSIKEEKHMSSGEIAKLSGIPQATISRIFSGVTPNPTFETVASIAIAMGVSLDEMTGLKNPEEAPIPSQIEKTINTYAELLNEKDQRIKDLKEEKDKMHKEKRYFALALACVVGFVLVLLTIDILNGHFGYFRY